MKNRSGSRYNPIDGHSCPRSPVIAFCAGLVALIAITATGTDENMPGLFEDAGCCWVSWIPLSLQSESGLLLLLLIYGVGTAIPVFAFGILIAIGARSPVRVFENISRFERGARRVTGVFFLGVGIYFALRYCFELW